MTTDFRPMKQRLIITGQMFGTGKSSFGRSLLDWNNSYIKDLFSTIKSSEAKTVLQNALTIQVDLKKVGKKTYLNTLDKLLSFSIWRSALQLYGVDELDSERVWNKFVIMMIPSSSCVSLLQKLLGRSLYIHIDEISAIEE
jgi:hypothetical protein